MYELSALHWITYAILELSVNVVPFPPGHAGAATTAVTATGMIVVEEAELVDVVVADVLMVFVNVLLDVAVNRFVVVDCTVDVLLSVDDAELATRMLEAARSGHSSPGVHASTEQHPVKPFAQL